MSNRNSMKIVKSCSEGEILEREETRVLSNASEFGNRLSDQNLLRSTFSLPRNPFSSRSSKRRGKLKAPAEGSSEPRNKARVFRRPSWRKFIERVIQHVSRDKATCSYEYTRRGWVGGLQGCWQGGGVPGAVGLRNHGNTCFMNAVLQCLAHTDILAEYFVLNQYKLDLRRRKRQGSRGELTEQLALLLKAMWTGLYEPDMSSQFKAAVDKHGSQYRGGQQHDAQEFLLWLLDKVHEELNTASKSKYKVVKNTFGRPDEVVAAETLANHVRCNNSFVHTVFQAQFRSSLTCPRCHRQSNTFDPFLCMSVPVPQTQHRPLYVTVLYTAQQPRQVKLGVWLPAQAEVRELRQALALDTGISPEHMLLTEVDNLGFQRTFSDTQMVASVQEQDPLFCLEMPQLKDASEDSGAYVLLCWVNILMLEDHRARFGCPHTMQLCRETSYQDLQKLILKEMSSILHDDVLVNAQAVSMPAGHDGPVPLFRIRVLDGLGAADTYLDPSLDLPLYTEAVEQALALCEDSAGPQHVKLHLEWDLRAKESTVADDSDPIEEHTSVKQLQTNSEQGGAVTLEECFELYTKAEVLEADDAWHCPSCNRKQEVVKKLGLWSLPDILVIHLKRFRQSKQRASSKLTTLVDFPLSGVDMSPHLASKLATQATVRWSPWKRPCRTPARCDDNVYDLYAVCNHHGQDLQGGHYTAYCRNPYDARWYCFDDTRVERMAECEVVTQGAYLLFYQRRGLAAGDHWGSQPGSRSHEELAVTAGTTSVDSGWSDCTLVEASDVQGVLCAADDKKQFPRGRPAYSTLQPAKRSVATETDAAELDRHSDDETASGHWEPAVPADVGSAEASPVIESRV